MKAPDKHSAKHRTLYKAQHPRPAPPSPRGGRDRRTYRIPDKNVQAVIDACRRGVPETKLAEALGINYRTWMRVREEDERIADILVEGRKLEEEELVSLLLDKARGGDLTATIFALKSRHGYRDIGTTGNGMEQRVNVTIHLPAPAATEAEFSRLINVTPGGDAWPN